MNSIISSWKTSAAGVLAGVLMMVASYYQPGMSWRQWASAVSVAIIGFLAKDHNVTGGTVPVTTGALGQSK